MVATPLSGKSIPPEKDARAGRFSERHVGCWRAVPAAGLQGKGSHGGFCVSEDRFYTPPPPGGGGV